MNHQDTPQPAEDDELAEIPDIEGEPPPVDDYRLSTRPGVVSGDS